MVIPPEEGGPKEARYSENNIMIRDSTLCSIIPPQLKNMSAQYKVMCGCECCISEKHIRSLLLLWRDHYLKKIKSIIQHAQKQRSGEMYIHLFETHKKYVMTHGRHIYA